MRRHPAAWLAALLVSVAACSPGAGGGAAVPSAVTSRAAPSPASPSAESPAAERSVSPTPQGTPSPSTTATATVPSTPPAAASPPTRPTAWAQLAATGPAAREDHTWTVAPDGGAWLFGGRDGGTAFDDLWRYDLATDTWEEVDVAGAGPAARFGHTATWVDGIGIVVWSGQAGTSFFDDLWAFDPQARTWRELPAGGAAPAARYGSCAALDPAGRLWVSHGFTADAGRFADTWTYDFAAGRWSELVAAGDVPVVRCLHDCLFTPGGRFLVYAGQTTGAPAIGDLWTRPAEGPWSQAPAPPSPARQLYAATTRDGTAWIFGGGGEDRAKLGDLWSLELETLAWQQAPIAGEVPSARSGATMVTDGARQRVLLFGGQTDDGASAEAWALQFDG